MSWELFPAARTIEQKQKSPQALGADVSLPASSPSLLPLVSWASRCAQHLCSWVKGQGKAYLKFNALP